MTDRRREAMDVLRANRRDGYTIPSPERYPFQWCWDSAFVALGLAEADPGAAKRELRTLFGGQWANGMLPHIVFWDEAATGYFPGPAEWDVRAGEVATSGITQPPLPVTAVRRVVEATGDTGLRDDLLPSLEALCSWWLRERSVDGRVVYVRHPWETGMDDSPAWRDPLAAVDPGDPEYVREDLTDGAADERPTDWDYDRYVHLYRHARALDWDEARIRESAPFLVEDVLTNSLFVRACEDLAALYEGAGDDGAAARWREQAAASRAGTRERLWDGAMGTFVSYDRVADEPLEEYSVAGLVPAFAGVPTDEQAEALCAAVRERFLDGYALPSYVGGAMDPDRYWRGPVWANTNWLVGKGIGRYDGTLAARVRADALELLEREGFREYFNPGTGEGRGSDRFSWSAALYLEWTGESS